MTSNIAHDTKIQDLPSVGPNLTSKAAPKTVAFDKAGDKELVKALIAEFKAYADSACRDFKRAGDAIARVFELDPEAMPAVVKATGYAPSIIKVFIRIGQGSLLPSLLTAPKKIQALPIEDQKRVAAGPVEQAVLLPGGKIDRRMVDLASATPEVYNQVIGNKGIRTVQEQASALSAKASKAVAEKEEGAKASRFPYRYEGGRVLFLANTTMGVADLETCLRGLKANITRKK